MQIDRVTNWLSKSELDASSKFFLWLHLYDVHQWHGEGNFPASYREKLEQEDQDQLYDFVTEQHKIPVEFFKNRKKRLLKAINGYDARLRYVDDQLLRLYQELEQRGLNQNSLWVITADHGEGLGNHMYEGHGKFIYQEQLHIPLIFHTPTGELQARTHNRLVQTVDLLPTFKELLGLPATEGENLWAGRSFAPLLSAESTPADSDGLLAFAQRRPKDERARRRDWEEGELLAVFNLEQKLIDHSHSEDEYFNLTEDPFELRKISPEELVPAQKLRDSLGAILKLAGPNVEKGSSELDPQALEELRALGYL